MLPMHTAARSGLEPRHEGVYTAYFHTVVGQVLQIATVQIYQPTRPSCLWPQLVSRFFRARDLARSQVGGGYTWGLFGTGLQLG